MCRISKALEVNYWLLFPSARNPNEHVNVCARIQDVNRFGIPHISIFSNASRSMTDKVQQGIEGTVVFSRGASTTLILLDQFDAAQAGYGAKEVVNDQTAIVDDDSVVAVFAVLSNSCR